MKQVSRWLIAISAVLLHFSAIADVTEYTLVIDREPVNITGKTVERITINGGIPGPIMEFTEGDEAVIHVINKLDEPTSVHWHGLLLPPAMDGVPGLGGYEAIKAGATFTYRFTLRQNGTYWYHAHSGTQEQDGHYGALVIYPKDEPVVQADRDYVVLLSDFSNETGQQILANIKKSPHYYNYAQRTVGDFFGEVREHGLASAWQDASAWGQMRMSPTDLADVSYDAFLVNGQTNEQNWTGLFKPGERVRLRFINASAMSMYDVRIPGLQMTVIQADGQYIEPVTVDEFRFAVAETYDVIVTPQADQAYTIAAESIDRTGFALGTLAPREGMKGLVPAHRPRSLLTMADMGHDMDHSGHDMSDASQNMDHSGHDMSDASQGMDHSGHDMSDASQGMDHSGHDMSDASQGMDHSGHNMRGDDHQATQQDKSAEMQSGWADASTPEGHKALQYSDLRALGTQADLRPAEREIVVTLGGTMERFIWTLNGHKFGDPGFEPIKLNYGERVRLIFKNETMMAHPMHLHGMFVQLENGQPGEKLPNKHTVNVAPGTEYSVLLTADEPGEWAFHCHLLYHMSAGMMSTVVVAEFDEADLPASQPAHHDMEVIMIITKSKLVCTFVLSLLISVSHAEEHQHSDHGHDSQLFHALWFEAQHGGGSKGDKTHIEWDGWIGGDTHKLWLKGELEGHKGKLEESEVWALYSRNVHDFWDAQLGLRVDTQPESTRYLTLGFNGLAPYLFETQAHLFISDYGDVSARLKQKNHLLFTQRFGFEPYYQLDLLAQNVERQDLGRGLSKGEFGIKLFYEITRKVVPYLDLKYERKFGRTASIARDADESEEDWIASVGIKLLF